MQFGKEEKRHLDEAVILCGGYFVIFNVQFLRIILFMHYES